MWLVVGVQEREPAGATIYNTLLYFSPAGELVDRHRKLVPTGSERTVWAGGDGSTLRTVPTPLGRLGGLICWENYMPLARFHLYAQGVDVWLAPTLALGDGWVATMRHLARENRMYVVGVNPALHVDQVPADFPHRDQLVPEGFLAEGSSWVEPGNSVIVGPDGNILAGPGARARGDPLRRGRPAPGRGPATPHGPHRPLQPARRVPPAGRHLGPPGRRHERADPAFPATPAEG